MRRADAYATQHGSARSAPSILQMKTLLLNKTQKPVLKKGSNHQAGNGAEPGATVAAKRSKPAVQQAPAVSDNNRVIGSGTRSGPDLDVYYDARSHSFLRRSGPGRYIQITEGGAKVFLRSLGISPEIPEGEDISPLERAILRIQDSRSLDYAAPLAGHQAGFYVINGANVLVTESPKLIEPIPGKTPLIDKLLANLFSHGEVDQRPFFIGWLKRGIETLRSCLWTPAQALVLAGPVNSGKSLLQRLITRLFGGRAAEPFRAMVGRTEFNADLFRAEHLMLEDRVISRDMRARLNLGNALKQITVNREQNCHGKHEAALTLTPIWRVTISVNDEPDKLQVIPPLTEDIRDKIMLLKVTRREMPMATDTLEEWRAFEEALKQELPAFMYSVLKWKIPGPLQCSRFGISSYQHPDLVQAISELEPHNVLLDLMDTAMRKEPSKLWTGTAAEFEMRLTANGSTVAREARRLLSFSSACGSYLGQLAISRPNRVMKGKMLHGISRWTVTPPPQEKTK